KGSIDIDERVIDPTQEKDLRSFSSYVSLISQDSHVFSETLKFNITLGADEGFEEFWRIATEAIPYLVKMGFSPDDNVKPRLLSMGQKQLISGLRALFLKKPIILMDEISSGLDSDLESALKDLIHFFRSKTMTIIVTHRLETILNSDQLILLEAGEMVAKGSFTQLKEIPKFAHFIEHL